MCRKSGSTSSAVNSFAMTGGRLLPEALALFFHEGGRLASASVVDHPTRILNRGGTHEIQEDRRTLAMRQFSLCGWEAASSQGRQAHWRGMLAASDGLFRVPALNRDRGAELGASMKLKFSWLEDLARRSQIRWHTQVACLCFSVLFANRIQPVRPVR
jgi:hypothetical protein